MTRRTRTKTRRPKFLSLRRQLAPPEPPDMEAAGDCHHQLSLFPLHPTTDSLLLIQDPDPNVACLLEPPDDADAGGATITAILGGGSDDGSAATQEPPSPTSSSMNWDGDGLARRALRGRERWVFCCSSASSPSSTSEDVASSGGGGYDLRLGAPQALSLKLDYEEILTAWSDRGPLYVDGGGPQVVPELHDAAVFVEVGSTWRVPEEAGGKAAEAVESREARVMRYKEKRRSRLFDKRIRYEVRKLNAEKRPRMKGRFVKKIDDA